MVILVNVEFKKGLHTSGVCFTFWLLEAVVACITLGLRLVQHEHGVCTLVYFVMVRCDPLQMMPQWEYQ